MSGWCNVSKCPRYHHHRDQHGSRVHALYHNHLGPGAHSWEHNAATLSRISYKITTRTRLTVDKPSASYPESWYCIIQMGFSWGIAMRGRDDVTNLHIWVLLEMKSAECDGYWNVSCEFLWAGEGHDDLLSPEALWCHHCPEPVILLHPDNC